MLQGIPLKCRIEAKASCLFHMFDESTPVVIEVTCSFSKMFVSLSTLCVMYIGVRNKLRPLCSCSELVILGQNVRIELGAGTAIMNEMASVLQFSHVNRYNTI